TRDMQSLTALLAQRDVVLDGGFATELEARGYDLRDSLWSARLLRDDPQAIEDVHVSYFESGADVAITSSYHATLEGFEARSIQRGEGARLLRLSVELAQRARERTGGTGLVAGSVGPYCVVWADGTEYTGDYTRATDEQIATTQRARIAQLVAAGSDVIAMETIPNGREAEIVAELLAEISDVEAWVSFCCRDGEHLSDGTPIGGAIRSAGRTGQVMAFGINCTPPQHIDSLLEAARKATDAPLLIYPNHGRVWDGATYTWRGVGVDRFPAEVVERWRRLGARAIGGCCGIGPAAIAELACVERAA
ncbi:MAG: homocysteine S-methyltransferase, partial [Gaiellaceae bacterium]